MELYASMKKEIEKIIRKAGEIMLEGSGCLSKEAIHEKSGAANYVTDYDIAIQKYLIGEFRKIIPDASFYGEEETEGCSHEAQEGYTFYIDPIDGTTNYLFGYDHSCVSVGVAYNGCIVQGYVYNPFRGELYFAERGKGSYLNDRRLQIENKPLSAGIAAFGCARYNSENAQFEIVKELFLRSTAIRNGGSAALDLCRIASGANVAYFETLLQPYDYAAASIIIEEAGGVIRQECGEAINLYGPCMIIAGTQKAVEEISGIVREENKVRK